MALHISTTKLRKRIIAYLTIYMLLASLATAAITLWPMVNYLKEEVGKSFLNGVVVRAVAIDERLEKMCKIAEQTSKRFGILSMSDAYDQGRTDLDSLIAYVEPRHRMVMTLSSDITGISQFDASGNPIVQLGVQVSHEFIDSYLHDAKISKVHIHGPIMISGTPQFFVHVPLLNEQNKPIGANYILFSLEHLRELLTPADALDPDTRFFLGTLNETPEKNIIVLKSDKTSTADQSFANQMLDQIAQKHQQDTLGLILNPKSTRESSSIATFVKLKHAHLVLVGKMSETNMYQHVDQFTEIILASVMALILVGTAGMFFLSRPLTGRVLIHSTELEELNRQLQEEIRGHQEAELSLGLALRETESSWNHVKAIIHSVPDALMVVDHEDRIELLNPEAEKLLAVSTSEAAGKLLLELVPEKHLKETIGLLLSTYSATNETDLNWPKPAGTNRVFQVRVSGIQGRRKEISGRILLLQEVTQQRRIEQMKSEFISTAAHELRTPMATIMGFSELLTSNQLISTEQQQEYLSYIFQKSEDMSKILDDLLDISRIESGRELVLTIEPLPIGPLIEQAVTPYRLRFTNRCFETVLTEPNRLLELDRGKFAQVMENLLSNAVKYSPPGSQIRISSELRNDQYQIAVKDQGIGMTAEQVDQVFDKFFRVDASNTAAEGTGLGMFIVRHIIDEHRGHIWIDSTLGEGTTVYFTLPLHPRKYQATPTRG